MHNILVVDDEQDILEFVKYNLEKEKYAVNTASSGKEALSKINELEPDVVLMDLMMPEMDGIECCMRIRELGEIKQPFIAFLTARNEDYSQIAGLNAGGDDYIAKPIKPRLLNARIKALLRRENPKITTPTVSEKSKVKIDVDRHLVIVEDKEIHLPKKQFNMLSLLISRAGKVVSRDTLMQKIWGNEVYVSERNIDVQIRKIRESIGNQYIKTIKGVGYKYID